MDERKQYAKKVVQNIIQFMAQAGAGILPNRETAEQMLNEIPEELHKEIMASLLAARKVKKLGMIAKLASVFPMQEILEKAMSGESSED